MSDKIEIAPRILCTVPEFIVRDQASPPERHVRAVGQYGLLGKPKGSAEMKHLLASLTVGACLLLPSAGVVLGAGPPTKPAQNPTTGQQGSNHGFSCTTSGSGINTPGNAINAGGSPFNPSGQAGNVYAGNMGTASAAHSNSTASVSQYDVACSHQAP